MRSPLRALAAFVGRAVGRPPPTATPMAQRFEPAHAELVSMPISASALQRDLQEAATALADDGARASALEDEIALRIAQTDHAFYIKRLVDVLTAAAPSPAPPLPDKRACGLGRWLEAAPAHVRRLAAFAAIAGLHEKLHDQTAAVARLIDAGRDDAAVDALVALDRTSTDLDAAFDELRNELREAPLHAA